MMDQQTNLLMLELIMLLLQKSRFESEKEGDMSANLPLIGFFILKKLINWKIVELVLFLADIIHVYFILWNVIILIK